MYILGISAMSHDSAAALLDDSGIVAAIEEGKLTRTRTIGGIPRAAIQFCLERAGIAWSEVAQVAVASQPSGSFPRRSGKASGKRERESQEVRDLRHLAGGKTDRVRTLDHHLCHAASAFYPSGFERALIVSLDERGDGRTGLVAIGAFANWIPSASPIRWPGFIRNSLSFLDSARAGMNTKRNG
jgi:carbamoyltransferase